jgi:hypothetical protein
MTDKQRIAELEEQNYYLQRNLRTKEDAYKSANQYAVRTDAPPKKKKKTATKPTKSGHVEAKFFAFLLILSIFAIGYLTEQWNRAGEQSARATAKTARK